MLKVITVLFIALVVSVAQGATFSLSDKISKDNTFCFLGNDKVLVAHSSYYSNLAQLQVEKLSTGEILYKQPQSQYPYRFMCTDKKVFGFTLSRRVQYNVVGNSLSQEVVDPILYSKSLWDTDLIFDQDLFAQGTIHAIARKPVPSDNWKYYAYDINLRKAKLIASIAPIADMNSTKFAEGQLLSIGFLTGQKGKVVVQIQDQRTGKVNLKADLSGSVEGNYGNDWKVPGVLFQPLQKKFVLVTNSELQFWDYSSGRAILTNKTEIGDNGFYDRNINITPDEKYFVIAVGGYVKIANSTNGNLVYTSPNHCVRDYSFHPAGDIFFSPDQKWIGVNYRDCTYLISRQD